MAQHGSTKRAATRRPRQPYQQGELDALCGVYSVVNAVRALCPEVDHDAASWLFDDLMQALPKVEANPAATVAWGLGRRQIEHLIKKAIAYVGDELDIAMTMNRLPVDFRRTSDLDALWTWLRRQVSPACVAVLGLSGRHAHWTVAVQVTPSQIRLFDSSRMGVLHRRHCTVAKANTRTGISPAHIFLITRRDLTP